MRITYLKLQNLVNVYAGLKKKLVEIDFSKSQNKKILILGDNGSGKTVLLSCLQPYRETNDNREMEVLDDETRATKEIHIQHGDNLYEIVHYYGRSSSQNKSFIKKNGELLNEAGSIRSFLAILEDELKITKDYFVLGRLGDNVDNFINLGMTERKKYLNKFIPSTDRFLEAYKRVSDNLQSLDRQIKTINVSLEKYGNKEENEANLQKLQERKEKLDSLKENSSSNLAVYVAKETDLKTKLQDYPQNLPDLITSLEVDIQMIKAQVGDLRKLVLEGEDPFNLELLTQKVDKLSELANTYLVQGTELAATKIAVNRDIDEAKSTIKKNIRTIETMGDLSAEALETRHEELSNLGSSIQVDLQNLESDADLMEFIKTSQGLSPKNLISGLDNLLTSIGSMVTSAPAIVSTYVLPNVVDLTEQNKLVTELESLKEQLATASATYKDLNEEYDKLNRKSGLLEILDHSEHSEHAKECPIVGMALGFKDQAMTITDLQKKLQDLAKEISDYQTEITKINSTLIEMARFRDTYKAAIQTALNHPSTQAVNQFIAPETFYVPSQVEPLLRDLIQKLSQVETYTAKKQDLTNVQEKLQEVDRAKSNLEILDNLYQENEAFKKSIQDNTDKLTQVEFDLGAANKKAATTKNLLSTFRTARDQVLQLPDLEHKLEGYKSQVNAYTDYQQELQEVQQKITDLKPQIVSIESELTQTLTELEAENKKHYLITENLGRLDTIHQARPTYKLVQDALDPKKGIPLIFSKNYLVAISERANELLDVAYKGSYQLKFVLETRDFRIEILKGDGNNLADITLASQGETSMTSISLSLAMLGQIMNDLHGYNILYLDEMDAELDSTNRKSFISVIDRQMELLGVDQTFIITHNNEFYSSDIDLILLNGYETKIDITDPDLMAEKSVIYKNY